MNDDVNTGLCASASGHPASSARSKLDDAARTPYLLVASQLDPAANAYLVAEVPGISIVQVDPGVPAELPPAATVFIARPLHASATESLPKPAWVNHMHWIQLLSAGADGYPSWYFDVPLVTCARGPTARPVAEFAMAAIFASAKQIPQIWLDSAARWKPHMLEAVNGKTLGIVGYGAVGSSLAAMARAMGMRVIVSRRRQSVGDEVVEVLPLQAVIAQADHLVIAAASTAQTRHLIDRAALAHAQPHMHLVNVARGALVDQDALLEALDAGRIAHATLDVTDPEPLPAGHRLYTHPCVSLSPHISGLDSELRDKVTQVVRASLRCFIAGTPLQNTVDRITGY